MELTAVCHERDSEQTGPFLMTAELLWLLVACDPTVGNPAQLPMFKKASKLAVKKARSNPRGDGQVAHDWLLKQYRRAN